MLRTAILSLAFIGGTVRADDAAFEAAQRVCNGLYGGEAATKCLKIVNEADYIDAKAIPVCAGLYGSDAIMKCLKVVRNRRYTEEAIRGCRGRYGSDAITECLEVSGRKGGGEKPAAATGCGHGGTDNTFAVAGLEKAISLLQQGERQKARQILKSVLETLK